MFGKTESLEKQKRRFLVGEIVKQKFVFESLRPGNIQTRLQRVARILKFRI